MNILLEASRRVAARVGGLPGRFWEEKGQTIFMVAVMLPLLLGAAAVVVDATNLFVNKRSVQNAADAAALAAARDLSTSACGSPCRVQVTKYARLNDAWSGVGDMPACASASDTNCVQNPYAGDPTKLEVSRSSRGPRSTRARAASTTRS